MFCPSTSVQSGLLHNFACRRRRERLLHLAHRRILLSSYVQMAGSFDRSDYMERKSFHQLYLDFKLFWPEYLGSWTRQSFFAVYLRVRLCSLMFHSVQLLLGLTGLASNACGCSLFPGMIMFEAHSDSMYCGHCSVITGAPLMEPMVGKWYRLNMSVL